MTSPSPYAEVIGDPINHSLSPIVHGFWIEVLGIDATYGRRKIDRSGLRAYVEQRRGDPNWRGSNVTMPLKLDAVALADEATDRAVAAGAANVLMERDGRLIAANTDVGAIAALLARLHKSGAAMRGITLLGSGGASRAALVALKSVGLSAVRIQARNMANAMKLAVEFGLDVEPAPFTSAIEGDGLINATPLGMAGYPKVETDLTHLTANGWVIDMVTEPAETALIAAAKAKGLYVATGLEMLVEQAAASFKLFFGVDAPRDRDAELWQRIRR